jgi:O-antigen ligase
VADIRRWPSRDERLPGRLGLSWTLLAAVAVLWQLLADLPDRLEVAGVSASAVLTVLCLGLAAALVLKAVAPLLARGVSWHQVRTASRGYLLVPLWLFVGLSAVTLVLHPTFEGCQNVAVYGAFVLGTMATCYLSRDYPAEAFLLPMRAAGLAMCLVYLAISVVAGPGQGVVYGARTVGLAAIVAAAVTMAVSESIVWSLVVVLAAVVSLSRTSTGAVILLGCLALALAGPAVKRGRRVVTFLAGSGLAVAALIIAVPPFRDRFLGGDNGIRVAGLHLNTSGRTALWSYTWDSAMQHRWFGGGAGNAEIIVMQKFDVNHPHNDYLRMFNDFGLVGLVLFLAAFAMIGVVIWRRLSHDDDPIHVAAFLALVGFAICALTDNLVVYPFVMVPLAVLLGLSLRQPAHPPSAERALVEAGGLVRSSGSGSRTPD